MSARTLTWIASHTNQPPDSLAARAHTTTALGCPLARLGHWALQERLGLEKGYEGSVRKRLRRGASHEKWLGSSPCGSLGEVLQGNDTPLHCVV